MVFILLGVLLVALKWAEVAPVTEWSWWIVLAPFALALAWWALADANGLTQRRAMRKDQQRKDARRRNLADGMGLRGLFDRSASAKLRKAEAKAQASRQRQIDKVEGERERKRQANRDSILTTRMDSKFDSRFDAPGQPGSAPGGAGGKAGTG